MFSIRVVTMDYYIGKPIYELYENRKNDVKEWQEPVIRIFGATIDGFKACVHVHGVYPYIYIPYKGGENPDRDALLIGAALDEALKTTLNTKIFRFVYKVTPVSGIPLYGYHSKQRLFFKIYFYNPCHIRKASELLLSGGILGQKFQPHEAHIPFALQFMMDYNIYGMSFATFSKVKYRRNPENPESPGGVSEKDFLPSKVKKITCSLLEVDALAGDIVNRIDLRTKGSNPGLRAIWEDEKNRRREQEKNSQVTVELSEPRASVAMHPTELMYKAQLVQKLKQISFQESEMRDVSDEPPHSYPAEVPEDSDFLEASAVEESVDRPLVEEHIRDVSVLIDERILTQIAKSQEEEKEEGEEEDTEADSVLGRNQKEEKEEEEEAELEYEEGMDMTQPLDFDAEVIRGVEGDRDEPGNSLNEDTFWRNMADKIFQLDGAQESSSESETDVASLGAFGSQLELSSAWSGNIMSILSEDSGCPTPSTVCQTPRTFWSNYSPNWMPQNQDGWAWNKSCISVSDFASKNESSALNSNDLFKGPKESDSVEPYNDLFTSNDVEYFQIPALTSVCNIESAVSSPPVILTHGSDPDGSDINLHSMSESLPLPSTNEENKFPSDNKLIETVTFSGKPESDRQKFLRVLKSFAGKQEPTGENRCQLTLKQYIKDCKEIVNVDFKNLCNKEMIIIEYKSENKRSFQNKYLIKPLDKFLESWDSAERKASDRVLASNCDEEGKNLRSVINVLEKRFADSSTVQSVSNKLTVKSMEILPDERGGKDRCYNINQNVISQGKIKMKLIKSQGENLEKNLVEGMLGDKYVKSNFKKMKSGKEKKTDKKQEGKDCIRESQKVQKTEKQKNLTEPDKKLINEINSSFEEYFRSIVQQKHFNRRKKSIIDVKQVEVEKEEEEEEEEEEEDWEEEPEKEKEREESSDENRNSVPPTKKRCFQDVDKPSNAESIKFVTRFLSTFSRMPDMPPLSITISLGNSRTSVPVQVNLQPALTRSGNEFKCFSKIQRRKIKVENVDGTADGSSSEDSAGGDSKHRDSGGKKMKRENYYKPLNVVVCGSSPRKRGTKKKRKISLCENILKEEEVEKKERTKMKMERKSFFANYSEDGFGACRENSKSRPPQGEKEEKISSENILKDKKNEHRIPSSTFQSSREVDSFESSERDFIGDSDEERNCREREPSGSGPRINTAFSLKRIPQADTEAFSSSDDDELNRLAIIAGDMKSTTCRSVEGKQLCGERVSSHSDEFSLESGQINKLVGERAEGQEAHPKGLFSVERDGDRIYPCEMKHEDDDSFSREGGISGPGTSLGSTDDSAKTLSGSPSLMSSVVSVEFESSAKTEGKFNLTSINQSSDFPKKKNTCSQSSFSGSSKETKAEAASLDWLIGHKVVRPKKQALTRRNIFELLEHYGIPESDESTPFYSNPRDVTKAVEAGPRILKIRNRSLGGLMLFKSSLDIVGVEERRNSLTSLTVERSHLVRDVNANIKPLIKPPTPKTVLAWSGGVSEKGQRNWEKTKKTIVKPLSPGEEMGSEEEIELSMTIRGFSEESRRSDFVKREENVLDDHSQAVKANDLIEAESGLKKGPISRIKGIKKFCLLKKSESTPEKAQPEIPHSNSTSPVSSGDSKRNSDNSFQIKGVTLDDTYGFRQSVENMQVVKQSETHQYMNMLVMEVHIQTRKNLRPDPNQDPIRALFYAVEFDSPTRKQETGIVVVGDRDRSGAAVPEHLIYYVSTEKELIEKLLGLMRVWDPEILAGYEIEMHSWGYLIERGFVLNMNLLLLLGRVQAEDFASKNNWDLIGPSDDADVVPRSVRHMRISGRIVLDVWRILRHEVALTSYTFENVMYHLSHERLPLLSYESLSHYWEHPSHGFRQVVVEHYTTRVLGVIKILDQLDFINRTSELSRLFGIQFYEVLSRGSQFRVESMMLRLAKPLNYISASPSVAQRAAMRAPASLPLILEPESLFYSDPVIVLDFQSLYPSIIIAYNYCFSTCLGRVEKLGGREPFEFGCTQLQISPEELRKLEKNVSVSPAGVAFVNSSVRKGILPAMLEEILETRLMVKKSLKEYKGNNKTLEKVLYARQLGLKLIANVTYGYTAANFSGRMPCIEVGDSVVSKGRETLHRAIQLVKSNQKWGAKVVYGDTDSIFVCTPGKSREEAFKIGAEIAEAVTQNNPKPVKLKLEKVYQPSILQTKKRYVGYMFESPEQKKPIFEAKGIETVRRDGCPATGKILEKALQILFDTRDVSLVKKYTVRQFAKLFQGRVNVQDLIFAKEYRGRKGYRAGACVPALELAKQWTQYDKRAEPRVKERVPYVIVNGPPGVPLIRLVRSPVDLISDPSLRINAVYYITKAVIPPMQRCFSLLGVDVMSWFIEMPRKYHKMFKWNYFEGQRRNTISQYFATKECVVCSEVTNGLVCPNCENRPQIVVVRLSEEIRRWERCHDGLLEICRSCCKRLTELDCVSLDCPILFRKKQAERALNQSPPLREILKRYA